MDFILQAVGDGGSGTGFITQLFQFGALGIMLLWFMLRLERVLSGLTHALRTQNQSISLILQVVTMLNHPSLPMEVRNQARQILQDATKAADDGGVV